MSAIAFAAGEISRLSARERIHWARSLYLATLATALAFSWLAECSGSRLWTEQEGVGLVLFRRLAWCQFALLNLAVLLDICLAMAEEKQTGILELLLTSPLSAFQIVTAKFIAAFVPSAVLMASGLPIFLLLLLFGGLNVSQVTLAFALTLASAGLSAAVALSASAAMRRPTASMLLAMVIIAFAAFAMPSVSGQTFWAFANPYAAFASLWQENSQWTVARRHVPLAAWLLPVAWALFLLLIAAAFLRRSAAQRSLAAEKIFSHWCRLWARWSAKRSLAYLEGGGNAFIWRETSSMRKALGQGLRSSLWAILLICFWLQYRCLMASENLAASLQADALLPISILIALAPLVAAASRAFAAERSAQTLDLILASPCRETEIVIGKALAVFSRFGPLLIVPALYALFLSWQEILPPYSGVLIALALVMAGAFLGFAAFLGSMRARPTTAIWLAIAAFFAVGGLGAFLAEALSLLGYRLAAARLFLPYWLWGYSQDLGAGSEAALFIFADLCLCLAWHAFVLLVAVRYTLGRLPKLLRCASV